MTNAIRRIRRLLDRGWAAVMCAGLAACTSEPRPPPLRLGTTTTVEQSGALALLDSLHSPVPLRVVVGTSGQILRSAAAGDLDVVVTHAPGLEQRLLIDPGLVERRCPFVASRFAIVGPNPDPAHVADAPTAVEAFRRIAAKHVSFISRGDSSGTHVKELALWRSADVSPDRKDPWYVQVGADQAATLRVADERHAYALVDLPTFARLGDSDLRALFIADTALTNPYTLYVVRSVSPHPGGVIFGEWALSEWRSRLVQMRLPGGTEAFVPLEGECQ